MRPCSRKAAATPATRPPGRRCAPTGSGPRRASSPPARYAPSGTCTGARHTAPGRPRHRKRRPRPTRGRARETLPPPRPLPSPPSAGISPSWPPLSPHTSLTASFVNIDCRLHVRFLRIGGSRPDCVRLRLRDPPDGHAVLGDLRVALCGPVPSSCCLSGSVCHTSR